MSKLLETATTRIPDAILPPWFVTAAQNQRFGRLVATFHSGVPLRLQLDPRGFSRTTEADGEAGSGDRLVEQASTVATDAMRSEFLRFCDLCTGVSVPLSVFVWDGMRFA